MNYKSFLIGLYFVQSFFIIFSAIGQETNYNVPLDSVRFVVQDMSATEKLNYLEELAKKQSVSPAYKEYIRLYEAEARKQHNDDHLTKALVMLGRSYYPEDPDSIYIFKQQLEPIARKNNDYAGYLDLFGTYNYAIIWQGRQEGVEESVKEYRDLAAKTGNLGAMELADQNMAYFYFMNNMPVEAEKLYLEALESKDKRGAPIAGRVGILVQLFNNLIQKDKREMYLQRAIEYIDLYKNSDEKDEQSETLMIAHEYSIHWTYASLLLEEGKSEEALEHMKTMEDMLKMYNMKEDRIVGLQQLYFEYYYNLKNWNKALEILSQLENVMRRRNLYANIVVYLEKRADIYTEQGRYKDAISLQKEIIHLQDSVGQSDLQEKVADMRTKYEVEKLQLEKQQIEIDSLKTRSRMTLLTAGCIFLLLAIVGLIYLVRITQRSKKSFKQAKEKAEEADQMKSAFLANMNHEIRTPLNAIVGFSQVLAEEEDKENRATFAGIIEHNNELLQRLIGDVLDISKIESNSMSLVYSQQDIPGLMEEIYAMISLRMPENVELILDPCKPLQMETDKNRLVQVVTNLLTNATKHTSAGHIRFGYRLSEEKVIFYVEDTGSGIKEDQLESIFDRFTQLENSKKGVGLGLAISRGLVEKMGGRIWVESVFGKGSTFFVSVPLHKPL